MCAAVMVTSTVPETAGVYAGELKTEAVLTPEYYDHGWIREADGQKRYYKNGRYLKGYRKIGNKYYFFGDDGILLKEDVTVNGTTYYMDRTGMVQGMKKAGYYFSPSGIMFDKARTGELRAYQNAKRVVNAITDKKMSKEEKLKVCFKWMQHNGLGVWRRLSEGEKSWYAVNANDLFEKRCGDCVSYACAFAYMAKVIGYRDVNVCSRGSRKDDYHTWTEINGLVYDSYCAKTRPRNKYYAIRYNAYEYRAVLRQKIPGSVKA